MFDALDKMSKILRMSRWQKKVNFYKLEIPNYEVFPKLTFKLFDLKRLSVMDLIIENVFDLDGQVLLINMTFNKSFPF